MFYGEKKLFDVKEYLTSKKVSEFLEKVSGNTLHSDTERDFRRAYFRDENAKPVDGFAVIVDRGHKNGWEVHILFEDGTIRIYNYQSCLEITQFQARLGQAKRLSKNNQRLPYEVFCEIRRNERLKLNEC